MNIITSPYSASINGKKTGLAGCATPCARPCLRADPALSYRVNSQQPPESCRLFIAGIEAKK